MICALARPIPPLSTDAHERTIRSLDDDARTRLRSADLIGDNSFEDSAG